MQALGIGTQSTALAVTEALRSSIVTGELKSGERLKQDAIASRYRVSQTVVREAFRQLAVERLLASEPRRGFFVPNLSSVEADEITCLRCLIEPQALSWAIPELNAPTISKARSILDQIDHSKNADDLLRLNNAFHYALYEPSERARTLETIVALRVSFERYLRFTWNATDHIEKSQAEHRIILEHCEAGDAYQACKALHDHIRGTGDLLATALREQLLPSKESDDL